MPNDIVYGRVIRGRLGDAAWQTISGNIKEYDEDGIQLKPSITVGSVMGSNVLGGWTLSYERTTNVVRLYNGGVEACDVKSSQFPKNGIIFSVHLLSK